MTYKSLRILTIIDHFVGQIHTLQKARYSRYSRYSRCCFLCAPCFFKTGGFPKIMAPLVILWLFNITMGKSPFYSWENPRIESPCSIAFCMFTGPGISQFFSGSWVPNGYHHGNTRPQRLWVAGVETQDTEDAAGREEHLKSLEEKGDLTNHGCI